MKGILSTTDLDDASLVAKAKASPGLVGRDLAREVMPRRDHDLGAGLRSPVHRSPRTDGPTPPVPRAATAARRRARLRDEVEHPAPPGRVGCRVTVVPGSTPAEAILEHQPDGIFLSNGPGDPRAAGRGDRHAQDADPDRRRGARGPDLRHLPGPPAPGPGVRRHDLQAQVRPPRRQPPGPQRADRQGRDHHPEPRLRRRPRDPPPRRRAEPRQPQRPDPRRAAPHPAAGLRRPVPPRGLGRPARQPVSLRRVPEADGTVPRRLGGRPCLRPRPATGSARTPLSTHPAQLTGSSPSGTLFLCACPAARIGRVFWIGDVAPWLRLAWWGFSGVTRPRGRSSTCSATSTTPSCATRGAPTRATRSSPTA